MDNIGNDLEQIWNDFVDFLPDLLGALLLAIVAILIAKLVSGLLKKAVDKSSIGERTNRDALGGKDPSLGKSTGAAAFWLIILLFIPPILGILGLRETLAPLNGMIGGVLEYLPRIIGALFIIAIGWLIATVARRAVTSLLMATPIDNAASRADLGDVIKGPALANAAGLIVFALILIPAVIAGLEALQIDAITEPATLMLQSFLDAIPNILAAGIVLFLTYIIARAAKAFLVSVLSSMGFDNFWRQLGFTFDEAAIDTTPDAAQLEARAATQTVSPSRIAGNIAMAAILIFGAVEAAKLLNFEIISLLLSQILAIGGQILLGAVVIIVGVVVARFVAQMVRRAGGQRSELVANGVQWGVIVLVTAMGLREMGLGEDIIYAGFILILGAAAVASALAFGIGGRDAAARMLERMNKQTPPRA